MFPKWRMSTLKSKIIFLSSKHKGFMKNALQHYKLKDSSCKVQQYQGS